MRTNNENSHLFGGTLCGGLIVTTAGLLIRYSDTGNDAYLVGAMASGAITGLCLTILAVQIGRLFN